MAAEDDVRKASQKFYQGLNDMIHGKQGALDDAWSHTPAVTTMHPIGGREIGWDAVKNAFDQVAGLATGGKIELRDQVIKVVGDMAYEVGTELGKVTMAGQNALIEQRVTNIYQKEGGQWKLVHHHTDISPAMLEILEHLQASAAH